LGNSVKTVSKRKTVAGGAAGGWREAVFAWAKAALDGGDSGRARAALDKLQAGSPLAPLAERFALSPLEIQVVELLFAVERSAAARKAAAPALTVERLREALADRGVDAALAPSRALRKHGLADAAFGGALASDEVVRLGLGLAHRLDGEPFTVDDLAPGIRLARAQEDRQIAPRFLALVERELAADAPDLVVLESASWHECVEVSRALARRQGRSVVALDAPACMPHAPRLFAALRRELDLDGHALVLRGTGAAGDGFWALAAVFEGLQRRVAALPHEAPPAPPPEAKVTVKDDGLDHIRRMAVRDAEMALGVVRKDPVKPAPVSPPPTVNVPPPVQLAPKPAPAAAPAAAPAKVTRRGQMPERIADKLRSRGIDPDTIEWQGEAEPEPEAAAPAPVVVAQPATAVEKSTQPYVDVPADAKPDLIAKVASTCPNPDQRAELIERLRGVKSPAVVAALRANAKSEHPVLRAVVESVMAQMFGTNWNVTRAVPKPVQPPPSDDKDRGPPGGY
jgi:hypothetical protein